MNISFGILIIFGISVFGGIASAFAAKKLKIPQILGYIVAGIIIGESGFKIVNADDITKLEPFNFFALGIIGFLVGAEIKMSTLKKYGKQFSAIVLGEGLLAFLLVGLATGLILYFVSNDFSIAFAGGIVFGAIASATDPASSLNVLQEYRTAGLLTTTIIAIGALDDALAMSIYGLGTGAAQMIAGSDVSTLKIIFNIVYELLGSVALGLLFGFFINSILHRSSHHESSTAAGFALLLLCIGIANQLDMDVILTTMSTGIFIINKSPKRSKELIEYLKNMSSPIFILFFVLVGARLEIGFLPFWLWGIILSYVFFRSFGKYMGTRMGATITKSEMKIRKYAGLGIFSQGGVAIGLSIMASQHLAGMRVNSDYMLGDVIIFGVTATTFVVQIFAPSCVKIAAKLAGEVGKNVTTEDILQQNIVKDNMALNIPCANESSTLRDVYSILSSGECEVIPVLDGSRKLIGGITINQLRESIMDQTAWDWVLASDLMEQVRDFINEDSTLYNANNMMEQIQSDRLPVLDKDGNFMGIITKQKIKDRINKEVLHLMNP